MENGPDWEEWPLGPGRRLLDGWGRRGWWRGREVGEGALPRLGRNRVTLGYWLALWPELSPEMETPHGGNAWSP